MDKNTELRIYLEVQEEFAQSRIDKRDGYVKRLQEYVSKLVEESTIIEHHLINVHNILFDLNEEIDSMQDYLEKEIK